MYYIFRCEELWFAIFLNFKIDIFKIPQLISEIGFYKSFLHQSWFLLNIVFSYLQLFCFADIVYFYFSYLYLYIYISCFFEIISWNKNVSTIIS